MKFLFCNMQNAKSYASDSWPVERNDENTGKRKNVKIQWSKACALYHRLWFFNDSVLIATLKSLIFYKRGIKRYL